MQLEELTSMDNYRGPCMHYMGIFLEDDAALSRTLESTVAGKIMSDWWDECTDAGPKRRPRSSFAEPVPSLDVVVVTDDVVKTL